MPTENPSVDRQRDGKFNLYVPRQEGEPEGTRPYRCQFDSLMEADAYAKEKFGVSVALEDLTLR